MNDLEEAQGELAEAHEALMLVIAERDALKAAVQELSARHQSKTVPSVKPCRDHLSFIGVPDCDRCKVTTIVVCSNLTCCTWPCEDRKAIDAALGGAS